MDICSGSSCYVSVDFFQPIRQSQATTNRISPSITIMDSLSAALAVQLQLNDIEELQNARKGKQPEGDIPDAEHALTLYAEELARAQTLIADRRMGCSMSRAVQSDAGVISSIRGEEDSAFQDRQVAYSLGGLSRPSKPDAEDFSRVDPTDKLVQQLSLLNMCGDQFDYLESNTETVGESSSARPPKGSTSSFIKQLCTACQEDKHFFDILRAPCGHNYCRTCIAELFLASTSDESLFPPRCCRQPIPLSSANPFLHSDLVHTFTAKAVEFSTPNRTYCSRETCSAFIPPTRVVGDVGTCPSCRHQICTLCKQDSHTGDCPQDTALQYLVSLAAENGWMRCYSCHRMVELGIGCNHMTYVSLVFHSLYTSQLCAYLSYSSQLSLLCAILLRLWLTMEDVPLCTVA